jgi:hypothetical protein
MSLFRKNQKDKRRVSRKRSGAKAWIRLDGGFALRSCNLIDHSDAGVCIAVETPEKVSNVFTFLTSRDSVAGRRVRIKWRRGTQIGAEFI